jgi:hypothetical protein
MVQYVVRRMLSGKGISSATSVNKSSSILFWPDHMTDWASKLGSMYQGDFLSVLPSRHGFSALSNLSVLVAGTMARNPNLVPPGSWLIRILVDLTHGGLAQSIIAIPYCNVVVRYRPFASGRAPGRGNLTLPTCKPGTVCARNVIHHHDATDALCLAIRPGHTPPSTY